MCSAVLDGSFIYRVVLCKVISCSYDNQREMRTERIIGCIDVHSQHELIKIFVEEYKYENGV